MPSFSFTTSRGGLALQPGDTYLASITGGPANYPVSLYGTGPAGKLAVGVGMTDANGNWSYSGRLGASDVGSWNETWSVGQSFVAGAAVPGSGFTWPVSFTVAAPSASAAPPASSVPALVPVPPVASTPAAGAPATSAPFSLASIPWWGWAAGAVGLWLAFGKR